MNLTTLNNQFHFNLPADFIPTKLEERYMKLLGAKRKLYNSTIDYLNSTILSVSYPGIKFPLVSNPQITKRKKLTWKTVGNIYDLFDDTITVTFMNVDSNINYMIFQDLLINHYLNTDLSYDQSIVMTVIDENRNALFHVQFRAVIWTGIGDNLFAFNDQTVQNKTFTLTFAYNYIDIEYVADQIDVITNNNYNPNIGPQQPPLNA